MPMDVIVRDGESQESLLRRFKKMVQIEGILRDAKPRRFLSKGETARMKAAKSARRRRKLANTSASRSAGR